VTRRALTRLLGGKTRQIGNRPTQYDFDIGDQ
jgi:hypothetical protein